ADAPCPPPQVAQCVAGESDGVRLISRGGVGIIQRVPQRDGFAVFVCDAAQRQQRIVTETEQRRAQRRRQREVVGRVIERVEQVEQVPDFLTVEVALARDG